MMYYAVAEVNVTNSSWVNEYLAWIAGSFNKFYFVAGEDGAQQ